MENPMTLNPDEVQVTSFDTSCEHGGVEANAYEIDHGGNGPCTCWC